MTAPHTGPSLAAPDLDSAVDALRAEGLRVSAARRLVLEALFAAERARSPPSRSPTGWPAGCRARTWPRSTATWRRSRRSAWCATSTSATGPGLYAPSGAGEREYLVCNSCSTVSAVDPEEMEPVRALIEKRFGYEASFSHFPILGLCADCAREESAGPSNGRRHAHD